MKDRNRTIVVGTDGSAASATAVSWAAELASSRHLDLEIVHGLQIAALGHGGGRPGTDVLVEAVRQDGERVVALARTLAAQVDPDLVITTETPIEAPAPLVAERSRRARLVVVGATGSSGLAGMLLGTTTATLVNHTHSPVAVIRGRWWSGSTGARRASWRSPRRSGASARGAPLVAVHAWSDVADEDFSDTIRIMPRWAAVKDDEERLLAQRPAGWQEKYPDVEIRRVLRRDRPPARLARSRGEGPAGGRRQPRRGGFTGMRLGSTGQALVQHAGCPVLVVRPEDPVAE
ncbi:universal stress protein [Amycolatopsis sp. FBCC-B4732]|uniref:universal stress protein n=1 Tax=Amycolatopsis sp. FBCC-B4732 TaxID=3079339 RepID=UPI001FF45604|nr:universal stress protein [Amycolatopsis sp. FBCC-B4732]UOX90460.1 universal stress protein [Amycolatopsis sp. FBCC-B4732]